MPIPTRRDAWLLASVCAVNQFKINMYEMGSDSPVRWGWSCRLKLFEDAGICENNYLINWANWLSRDQPGLG